MLLQEWRADKETLAPTAGKHLTPSDHTSTGRTRLVRPVQPGGLFDIVFKFE